jgi:prepilin-type N-terminal cleavage/methylation domain-containing protein
MKRKGFTLVELLAVIVIIALLIVVAVPITNTAINEGKKKSFAKYVDKLYFDVLSQYEADKAANLRSSYSCYIYDIKKDLGLDNTKNYTGYVVVVPTSSKPQVYFTIHDKSYYIKHYKYIKEETDSDDDKKTILEVIEKYSSKDYVDNLRNFVDDDLGCSSVIANSSEY